MQVTTDRLYDWLCRGRSRPNPGGRHQHSSIYASKHVELSTADHRGGSPVAMFARGGIGQTNIFTAVRTRWVYDSCHCSSQVTALQKTRLGKYGFAARKNRQKLTSGYATSARVACEVREKLNSHCGRDAVRRKPRSHADGHNLLGGSWAYKDCPLGRNGAVRCQHRACCRV